jgi:hypothetical protein
MVLERRYDMSNHTHINVAGKPFEFGIYADGALGDTYVSRKACEIADSICPEGKSLVEQFDEVNVFPFRGIEDVLEIALNTLNYYTKLGGHWEFISGDFVLSSLDDERPEEDYN